MQSICMQRSARDAVVEQTTSLAALVEVSAGSTLWWWRFSSGMPQAISGRLTK